MVMITKPMLAGTLKDIADVQYPVLVTPKLDGIRCLKIDGKAVSRNFKPIPNKHIRLWIEKYFPDGVDGELIVEGESFQSTTSAVMRESGEPNVVYYVFDYVRPSDTILGDVGVPYWKRMENLADYLEGVPKKFCYKVLPVKIENEEELLDFEHKCLHDGHEGVMIRTPHSPYKCGRSTVKEGYLLKLKRFEDAEAEIVGFEERMHNANEAKKDAFGRTERSSHKANMVPMGVLGAFRVKCRTFAKEFSIGTGMDDAQRAEFWKKRKQLMGEAVKFKYQPIGVKDVPRFPVFLGLRHENDL